MVRAGADLRVIGNAYWPSGKMRDMAIDRSGKWWRSETPDDLAEYLSAYTADGYPVGPVRVNRPGESGDSSS